MGQVTDGPTGQAMGSSWIISFHVHTYFNLSTLSSGTQTLYMSHFASQLALIR